MSRYWTEARIAAALEGHFFGIDGKCQNEAREKARREALADKLAARQAVAREAA